MLRLADALGIARVPELVCPRAAERSTRPAGPYAVIHAAPMFRYKQWTMQRLARRSPPRSPRAGLRVIATGGPAEAERRYLDEVWDGAPVTRRDGQLAWPQLAGLLSQARVYVGPDTSVTHLAAAAGCPTVALYGPTDPRLWGPWPVGGLERSGRPPARSSAAAMSGWCRIRCRACRASSKAASGGSTATANASIELPAEQVIAAADQALAAAKR